MKRLIQRFSLVTVLLVAMLTISVPVSSAAVLPVTSGLLANFTADNYNASTKVWTNSASDGSGDATATAGAPTKVSISANSFGNTKAFQAVEGVKTDTIDFGMAALPATYTFFSVARYNPATSTDYSNGATNSSVGRSRIFTSKVGNWLSGFWAGFSGVAYHDGWKTSSTVDTHRNQWVLSSDVASPTYRSSVYRSFSSAGPSTSTTNTADSVEHGLIINGGIFPLETSRFQIAAVISYNRILTAPEVKVMEAYLSDLYGIRANVPSVITVNAGNNQSAATATQVATAPAVLVVDDRGVAVESATVTFAIATGGGSLASSGIVFTNTSGIATSPAWTLGPSPGSNTLTASTTYVSNITFTETATDTVAPTSIGTITALYTNTTSVSVGYVASDSGTITSVAAYYSTSPALTSPSLCGSVTSAATSGTITCTIPATNTTYYIYTRATDSASNVESAPSSADDSIVKNDAISLAGTTQTLSATYGRAASDTVTATLGTGTKTFVLTGTSNAGITIDTTTANRAVLNVSNTVAASTYYETLTATDTLGANATYAITLTVSKADTLTITAGNPSTLTYTGSTAIFTPTYTTTGLSTVNTISGVTYTYSAPTVATCAQGGPCTVGDTGPAGGKVFYVSDTVIDVASGISTGGIYLEAAPAPVDKTEYNWCEGGSAPYTTEIFANGSEVGTGASNTLTIANNCTGGAGYEASHLTVGGYSDWFLPSSGEQIYMYYNMPTIGLVGNEANYLYAGSTETANWIASSLVPGAGIGNQNKGQGTPYWPIRAFSVTVSSLPGYGPSATKPTNAGTYSITPSAVTFTGSGSTSNYQAVVYVAGSLTINKASQGALSVASLQAVFSANPTTITLYTTGGSDTGTVSFALDSGGSATSCTLSGTDNTTLSVASAGTCLVTATKAATTNYLVATASGTINFYTYLSYTTQSYGDAGSHTIVLTGGGTPWSVVAGSAPSISGISLASGPVGTVITISGTGFNGVNVVQLNRVDMASFTGLSPTSISATIPGGATSGPIYVENEFGGDFFFSGFTVTS